MWAPKSWLQSNCYPVLPSQHETQMVFGIKNTLGSKLTHQSTFLYNIKSTIRTLVAWLSMATSRPCIQLSKYVYQYIFQIQGLTKCITNNKIHDRSRIYMAQLTLVLPLEHLRSKLNTTTDRGLFWDQTLLNVSILHK